VDLYLDHNTALHRMDPRAKIFAFAAAIGLAMAFNHPVYVLAAALLVLALTALGRAFANLWRLRAILLVLFVFSCVLWPLLLAGPTQVARLGPLRFSRESLLYGLAVGIRLDTIVAAGLLFLSTTRVEEFTTALRRLGLPFPVSFAFAAGFRFLPTFIDSAYTIIQAQKSRGLDLESGGVITRIRRHVPLLIPAVVGAVRNTDLLAMALESRGFGATIRRTEYLEIRMRWPDWMVTVAFAAALAGAVWWRATGHGSVLPRL
jgi:energy-coupling factor transport system permease protein